MEDLLTDTTLANDELISDEVKEIISYRPHWIIRKGSFFLFLILASLLILTWFIKYPDVVHASSRLLALNAPKLIVTKREGNLAKLFVVNEQEVRKGQHLAYIGNTAEYQQVMKLYDWVTHTMIATGTNNFNFLMQAPLPQLPSLGDLQQAYQVFQNEVVETKQLLSSGYYERKKRSIYKDLQYISALKNNTYQQQELLEKDKQLQNLEYDAYDSLAKDKVIAPLELNQYKSKLITKEQGLKQISSQLTNSDIAAHGKEKEIMDLNKLIMDQQQKFRSGLFDLKSTIENWVQQYVLIAPEDGKLFFTSSLQENELLSNGQNVFYIQPKQSKCYAELMASQNRLGKIKEGQKVIIRVESFPSEEYGYLIGKVENISKMPNRRDSFLVRVKLPRGLKTSYNKEIIFSNNLLAQADIIADNRKLFDRLVGQLKQVWDWR